MQALMEHLQARWAAYVGLFVCSLPLLYLGRRYVVPVVTFVLEIVFFVGILHVIIHGFTRLTAWYSEHTAVENSLIGVEPENPGWTTPLAEFWNKSQYSPEWIFYVELALLCVITYIVWRYRPIRPQKLKPRAEPVRKGIAPPTKIGAKK